MSTKYSVIYADPPWQTKAGRPFAKYADQMKSGKQVFGSENNNSRNLAYDTMTVEDIAAMNIKSLCEKDAHLYLWVTNQHLMQAEKVINAWGFNYSTTLVWTKKPMGGGLGGTFRITTEFLLFCTRGSLKANRNVIGTWFDQKRQYVNGYPCHSKKPDFFRKLIESVSPGERLELFARDRHDGWDAFGNEIENSITL